jgi:two-component system sensor histidine kinase KdpD
VVRPALTALALTGVPTLLAAIPGRVSTATAAMAYVLSVTAASALGGLRAGLGASVLSSLALNFFFTEPFHTLTVARVEDVVALAVFLIVSGIVGTLLSTAVSQRERAERREREARVLHRVGTRLLSGEEVGDILEGFARAVTELFSLARCEIRTELTPDPVIVETRDGGGGEPETVDMSTRGRRVGQISMIPTDPAGLGTEEREVIQTLANQMGLAVEGVRLGREAASARLEAETNRLRAALFSSVTHDLKTPLASITASVTSLQGEEASFTDEDRSELLETIRQEADRLDRLVGDLLDLSRIRAGALIPAKERASIEEVIEGVVARLHPVLAEHEVILRPRPDLPEAPMDVVQIDQVLTNLLENAAKYSPPGTPITISAARWRDMIEVRVIDRGSGIPVEERERVFELFATGDADGRGTGMGLAIGQAIVESHGGRIRIEGTPGGGSTVVFQIPVGAAG